MRLIPKVMRKPFADGLRRDVRKRCVGWYVFGSTEMFVSDLSFNDSLNCTTLFRKITDELSLRANSRSS